MSDTTDMEKLRILTMWECGKSTAEIAKSVNKSARTVQRWLAHQRRAGNMNKKPRGVRPRKTTPEEDARIVQVVKENPELTQKEIITICNLNIYTGTLRRRIQEANGVYKLDLFPSSKQQRKLDKNITKTEGESTEVVSQTTAMPSECILDSLITNEPQNVETKAFDFVATNEEVFTTDNNFVDNDLFTFTAPDILQSDVVGSFDRIAEIPNHVKVKVEVLEGEKLQLPENVTISESTPSLEVNFEPEEIMQKEKMCKTRRKTTLETISDVNSSEMLIGGADDRVSNPLSHVDQEELSESYQVEDVSIPDEPDMGVSSEEMLPDDGIRSSAKKKRKRYSSSDDNIGVKATKKRIKKEKTDWVKDRKDTTNLEKHKILIMVECGMTTEHIARSLKKSRRTVQRWISKHNHGQDMSKKERGRRPRKTTPEEDARIVQLVKENPTLSRAEILQMANINLHKVTLKNRLNEAGIFFNSQGVKILDFSGDPLQESTLNETETTDASFLDETDETTVITCSSLTPTPAITNAILSCPTLSTTLIITEPCDEVNDPGQPTDQSGNTFPEYSMY